MSDMTKAELVRKVALLQAENQRLRYQARNKTFWRVLSDRMFRDERPAGYQPRSSPPPPPDPPPTRLIKEGSEKPPKRP